MAKKKLPEFDYTNYWKNPPKTGDGKLTYPVNLDTGSSDHIVFSHFPYSSNMAMKSDGGGMKVPPSVGNTVTLYMPNSTPPNTLQQKWEDKTFLGAAGNFLKGQIARIGGNEQDAFQKTDNVEAIRQTALDALMREVGQDAGTAIALGRGKSYNPNIEMIYRQPLLRNWNFTFTMSPSNIDDTRAIDAIIKEFKLWSAPSIESTSFMVIPHLWMVQYKKAGGVAHDRMGSFKPCAITEVTVQDNPTQDMHMSLIDGTPVVTALSVTMTEIDIVSHEDHDKTPLRGM